MRVSVGIIFFFSIAICLTSQDTVILVNGNTYFGKVVSQDFDEVFFPKDGRGETRRVSENSIKKRIVTSSGELQDLIILREHEDGYDHQKVVHCDSANADENYITARIWFSDTFVEGESVLDMSDRHVGVLIGTGWQPLKKILGIERKLWSTIKIEVREGRFRDTKYEVKIDMEETSWSPELTAPLGD